MFIKKSDIRHNNGRIDLPPRKGTTWVLKFYARNIHVKTFYLNKYRDVFENFSF